jgi:hypothetical protein
MNARWRTRFEVIERDISGLEAKLKQQRASAADLTTVHELFLEVASLTNRLGTLLGIIAEVALEEDPHAPRP